MLVHRIGFSFEFVHVMITHVFFCEFGLHENHPLHLDCRENHVYEGPGKLFNDYEVPGAVGPCEIYKIIYVI